MTNLSFSHTYSSMELLPTTLHDNFEGLEIPLDLEEICRSAASMEVAEAPDWVLQLSGSKAKPNSDIAKFGSG